MSQFQNTDLLVNPPGPVLSVVDHKEQKQKNRKGNYSARIVPAEKAENIWSFFESNGALTAFQRWDWINDVDTHIARAANMTSVFVEVTEADSAQPAMLLAFVLRRHLGMRTIGWLERSVCDYAAPLMVAGMMVSPEQSLDIWRAVRAILPKADVIDISQIPADVANLPNPLALVPHSKRMALEAFGIDLAGDPATLLSRLLTTSQVRDLRMKQRRLARQGLVKFTQAQTEAEIAELHAVMCEQRRRRFEKLGRFNLLSRPEVSAFYLSAAQRGLRTGPARLFGLSVDGEWAATAFALVHGKIVHEVVITINDKWFNCSPGLLIVAEQIHWARSQDFVYFDLSVGNLAYKSSLGARKRELYRLLEARTLSGMLYLYLISATIALHRWLLQRPRLFECLQSVRKHIRQICRL